MPLHLKSFMLKIYMDDMGLSKLRYVGGWLAHSLIKRAKSYAVKNMYTESEVVGKKVLDAVLKMKLVKANIVVPYEQLSSKQPTTTL